MWLRIVLSLLIARPVLGQANGYAAYAGGSSSAPTNSEAALAPAVPLAPPRIPLPAEGISSSGSSLGYRPPPPPLRRDEKSIGQCSFGEFSIYFVLFFNYFSLELIHNFSDLSYASDLLSTDSRMISGK